MFQLYRGNDQVQSANCFTIHWYLSSLNNLDSQTGLQVFSMDIHPQAKFGKGILMDHGTGIVVGQTAVVGNNVSILQNVTLGGEAPRAHCLAVRCRLPAEQTPLQCQCTRCHTHLASAVPVPRTSCWPSALRRLRS